MAFILRRLAFYLAAFVVAAAINFALPRLMPGNPIDIMFSQAEGRMPPALRDGLAETFGFTGEPLWRQFLTYLSSVFTWDLGTSIKFYPLSVAEVLGYALPWTILLAGASALISFSIGSLLGINAAWRRGSRFDTIVSPSALVMQSIPAVVLALTTLFVFGVALRWLPTGYAYAPVARSRLRSRIPGSVFAHAVMPVFSLVFSNLGGYLDHHAQQHDRADRRGLCHDGHRQRPLRRARSLQLRRPQRAPAEHHRIRLSRSDISWAARWSPRWCSTIPGLGNTLYLGIIARDYPLIQGQLLIMTLAILTANFLVDLIYVFLDPRLRRA